MPTTTKAALAATIAERVNIPARRAAEIMDLLLDSMAEALRRGEKVEIRGFGSFRVRERRARLGRNPRTGESVQVSAKRIVYYTTGKGLQQQLLRVDRNS